VASAAQGILAAREAEHFGVEAQHWVCLREASITLPYSELILRTSEGIPYAAPEVALLFKAKQLREKDIADFQRVLPTPRANETDPSGWDDTGVTQPEPPAARWNPRGYGNNARAHINVSVG
jgi:hypothetical protein